LTRAGARLITLEPDDAGSSKVDPEKVKALLDSNQIDGVLLSGGGDVDPELYGGDPDKAMLIKRHRDNFEIALIKEARTRYLPIRGICRGCQILNVAFGGTLRNLRDDELLSGNHFTVSGHAVEVSESSRLAGILGVSRLTDVHSFHGQAVDRLGENISIAATANDGVIEAIEVDAENDETWIFGVQWHPEMALSDETQNRLFHAFVEQAGKAR